MERIGVIGAGQMGNGIAQVFAQHGYTVTMVDVSDAAVERGLRTINSSLDRLIKKGTVAVDQKDAVLSRIAPTTDLNRLANAEVVVEAATERRDLKFDLFRRLDALCQAQAILASNTSSISITELAAQTTRPAHVIGMHFFNPVPVMGLVEIVRGLLTDVQSASLTMLREVELRAEDGRTLRFAIEGDTGITPSHAREHMVNAEPVTITYRSECGQMVALRIED